MPRHFTISQDGIVSTTAPFHFTIATTPEFDSADQFTVKGELQLVKVALLYADRARLFSPGTSMVIQLRKHRDANSDEDRREYVVDYLTKRVLTDPNGEVGQLFPKLQRFLRSETDPIKRETVVRSRVRQYTMPTAVGDAHWESLVEEAWELGRRAGADGILEAVDSGLLELHVFSGDAEMGWVDRTPERDIEKAIEFVETIAQAMVDQQTYPVFDTDAAAVACQAEKLGLVDPSEAQVNRGKHARLAAEVLGKLPTFEAAGVDEILDVRKELSGELAGFRGAMSEFASKIRAEPWNENFGLEAEEAFVREVEPRVEEIRQAVEANNSLASLARKTGNPYAMATGLSVLLAGLPVLPAVAAVALGVGIASGATIYSAHKEWAEEQTGIRTNQMYFYYRANEAL